MSNSNRNSELSIERRNEIALKALTNLKIRNGFRINFPQSGRQLKNNQFNALADAEHWEVDCTEEEFAKFLKEGTHEIMKVFCKTQNIDPPDLNYTPDESSQWIKRRNAIGWNYYIHESTKKSTCLKFKPDSEEKKAMLMKAYNCTDQELKLFGQEVTHVIFKKAFELFNKS